MTTTPAQPSALETVELSPSYGLPLSLVGLAIPMLGLTLWGSGAIALFGLFLLYQTVSLRLRFTPTALEVYRGETQIRRFPYQDWQNWKIFWEPLPILFYFKEVNSIHFVPVLFDPKTLKACLEHRCPTDR